NPATQGPEEEIRRLRARLAELLEQGRPDVASDDDGPALQAEEHDRIEGGGELGALIRGHDWSKTILGPMSTWPQSLKTSLRTMLHSRYPMFVWWGRELINFYNDAYIPILGKRHPWALGLPSADVWTEIWSEVGRQAAIVLN